MHLDSSQVRFIKSEADKALRFDRPGNSEPLLTAALAGLGVILQPLELVRQSLRDGLLREVLPAYRPIAPPISVLYARDRRVTPKLRSFLDL